MKKNETIDDLNGPDKAAILLLSMGESFATKVIQNLKDQEIKVLGKSMSKIKDIPGELKERVLEEFSRLASSGAGGSKIGKDYVKGLLAKVVGEKKAETIVAGIDSKIQIFQKLDTDNLIKFLKDEHPQTAALVIAHLPPEQAADVLNGIGDSARSNIILRMANLDKVSSEVINEIIEVLSEEIESTETGEKHQLGGANSLAEILNNMDRETESDILEEIEENKPDLAEEIRKLMFIFDDIVMIDDRGMQAILKEVSKEDLALSMKKADNEVQEKFLKNMSERAATMLKEDLEVMGPVKLSDVEKAQQSIIKVAKRLESSGKITIGGRGGGEEDVMV